MCLWHAPAVLIISKGKLYCVQNRHPELTFCAVHTNPGIVQNEWTPKSQRLAKMNVKKNYTLHRDPKQQELRICKGFFEGLVWSRTLCEGFFDGLVWSRTLKNVKEPVVLLCVRSKIFKTIGFTVFSLKNVKKNNWFYCVFVQKY